VERNCLSSPLNKTLSFCILQWLSSSNVSYKPLHFLRQLTLSRRRFLSPLSLSLTWHSLYWHIHQIRALSKKIRLCLLVSLHLLSLYTCMNWFCTFQLLVTDSTQRKTWGRSLDSLYIPHSYLSFYPVVFADGLKKITKKSLSMSWFIIDQDPSRMRVRTLLCKPNRSVGYYNILESLLSWKKQWMYLDQS